jgi:hypothetical protein
MPTKNLDVSIEPARSPVAVGHLPDAELEDRLKGLAGVERKALVMLLAHLGEFDRRRLHADRGHPSLFSYCVRVLGYSEQAAYKRIQAARAARAHPAILQRLADGEVTLTAVVILSPHFRRENVLELLATARGKRTREVEALAAGMAPRPDGPDCLRALASPSELIEPLSKRRYLFRFTGSSELLAKYERVRELRGAAKSGDSMGAMVEAGLDALLNKLDPKRRIARRRARAERRKKEAGANRPDAPHPASRRIAAALRDTVWERDGGRCTFVGPDGARCPSTSRLEIDHVRPYALGGPSDDAANLRVMCREHNQLLARRVFGAAAGPNPDYPQG